MSGHRPALFTYQQAQVEPYCGLPQFNFPSLQSLETCTIFRRLPQAKDHLEDRMSAQIPPGLQLLDHLLERNALMRIRAQRGLSLSLDQLLNPEVSAEFGLDREHVHEE